MHANALMMCMAHMIQGTGRVYHFPAFGGAVSRGVQQHSFNARNNLRGSKLVVGVDGVLEMRSFLIKDFSLELCLGARIQVAGLDASVRYRYRMRTCGQLEKSRHMVSRIRKHIQGHCVKIQSRVCRATVESYAPGRDVGGEAVLLGREGLPVQGKPLGQRIKKRSNNL